ncbi:sigma-70 family RNA polymerase sigma factor [candidate division KSB1 bacterium]|nr:sigma-70 family RNA polymerase sigma factor [candidate division KSB1 bacterium]
MKDEYQLRLVQRIQAGDATADQELFCRFKDPILWKICRHVKTDSENIKDLAGEIYVAILEGLRKQSFQPEKWETLEAYIWGVVNNKIRDWFKKEKRENKIFDGDPPSEEIAAASEEFWLENEELEKLLKTCLQALEFKYKEALELRYFKELSVPEISAQLGIPPRRVSERIHYALKLLRQAYQKKAKGASISALIFLLF